MKTDNTLGDKSRESWIKEFEDVFRYDNQLKFCWFVHNGETYEMTIKEYKVIRDILDKSIEKQKLYLESHQENEKG